MRNGGRALGMELDRMDQKCATNAVSRVFSFRSSRRSVR